MKQRHYEQTRHTMISESTYVYLIANLIHVMFALATGMATNDILQAACVVDVLNYFNYAPMH